MDNNVGSKGDIVGLWRGKAERRPEQINDQLQRLVDNLVNNEKTIYNAVLGVARGDPEFRWSGAAGFANPAERTPMQAETPFFIASITKMYTAATIMILQDRGRLTLDDKISKHLPSALIEGLHHYRNTDYTGSLTVRHLISHTSGFADYFLQRPKQGKSVFDRIITEGDQEWPLEDVVRLTKEELPAKFPPATQPVGEATRPRRGAKAYYSDTNYKLLGAIIESVTERSLHTIFEDFFFGPLNLSRTYLYGHRDASVSGEPARVFYKDRAVDLDKLMSTHGPEGGIVSTVDDSLRFLKAFMQGELFARKETLETMQRWNKIFFPFQYGYGLMRFKMSGLLSPFQYSPELIGHSGSSGSFLFFCKELDLYMAGTINQTEMKSAPFRLMLKVAQIAKRVGR